MAGSYGTQTLALTILAETGVSSGHCLNRPTIRCSGCGGYLSGWSATSRLGPRLWRTERDGSRPTHIRGGADGRGTECHKDGPSVESTRPGAPPWPPDHEISDVSEAAGRFYPYPIAEVATLGRFAEPG